MRSSSLSKISASSPKTMRPYIEIKRRYESYAKRSLCVVAAKPFTLLSLRPKFKTVSIMPGMENFAPERTDTRSGSFASPRARPIFFSSDFTWRTISASNSLGQPLCMYARHASVVIVKPCGTGRPKTVIISARFAPLPPRRSLYSIGERRCL